MITPSFQRICATALLTAFVLLIGLSCASQTTNSRPQVKKKLRYYNSLWLDAPKREKPPKPRKH